MAAKPRKPKKSKKPKRSKAYKQRTESAQASPPLDLDALPTFDRRMMERPMRELAASLGYGLPSNSALDEARDLMDEAFESPPAEQVALAQEALDISPDCADALVVLAEHAETAEQALSLYRQGVAAGERVLGEKEFRECEGQFWGILETRPYMRARQGLADCLWLLGYREEAVDHYEGMLRLNPNDNQGIRYPLVACLLDLDRHEQLESLLARFEEDVRTDWQFTRALLSYRKEGDSPTARRLLDEACKSNEHVPAYLAGAKTMPAELPDRISLGGEDEAVSYVSRNLPAWKNTSGATAWMRKTLKVPLAPEPRIRKPAWQNVRPVLANLPQAAGEVWQVDTHRLPDVFDENDDRITSWLIAVIDCTDGAGLAMDFCDERPTASEVWEQVVGAMRKPQDGDPRRPRQIQVRLKTFAKAWQSKLEEIGVACRQCSELDQLAEMFRAMDSEKLNRRLSLIGGQGEDVELGDVAQLPQYVEEVWQADVRRLQMWISGGDDEPARPWIALVANRADGTILANQLTMEEPDENWFWRNLQLAMCNPAVGEARRPGTIELGTHADFRFVTARLQEVGVQADVVAQLDLIDAIASDLTEHLDSGPRLPATLQSPGMTAEKLSSFYEAAAEYYRRAPWRNVPGDFPIRIECDAFDSSTWYGVVMGQSGVTLGLAMYEDLDLLMEMLSGAVSDEDSGRHTAGLSVTYGEEFDVAPVDLDAAQENGWPIAGPEAYPCPLRVNPGFAFRPPLVWELELLEGCMRAIPQFVETDREEATYLVPVASGELTLKLSVALDSEP